MHSFTITYRENYLLTCHSNFFFFLCFSFLPFEIQFIILLHYCILIYFTYYLLLSESQSFLKGIRAISQFSPG